MVRANQPDNRVVIKIGAAQLGRLLVDFAPSQIEMVRTVGYHGVPHVLPAEAPDQAWIEVLGGVPGSEVVVEFYTGS